MSPRVLPFPERTAPEPAPINPEAFADGAHALLQRALTVLVRAAEEAGDERAVLWALGSKLALRHELERFKGAA